MMNNEEMSGMDAELPPRNTNAVSIFGQDTASDEFPILKAFQQYVDAEQNKARKRLVSMAIFFGVLMAIVIAVFLVMLVTISERNQKLNDRLIEFAMSERSHQPLVVQSGTGSTEGNATILSLTKRLEELQTKMMDAQQKAVDAERAQKEAVAAAAAAALPKTPSPEQQEINRLKALLKIERDKASLEKKKQREAEIEAYRRKHYPDLYRTADEDEEADEEYEEPVVRKPVRRTARKVVEVEETEPARKPAATRKPKTATKKTEVDLDEIDAILKDVKPVRYFDDPEEEDKPTPTSVKVDISGNSADWKIPE